MMKKAILTLLMLTVPVSAGCADTAVRTDVQAASSVTSAQEPLQSGFAGRYLSSQFAQNRYDWAAADRYLGALLDHEAGADHELIRRSMILSMGAGNLDGAVRRAEQLVAANVSDDLALMILAVNDMVQGRMESVAPRLAAMNDGDMTSFVKPVLNGWAAAAQGDYLVEGFNETTIHNYHGALIATFLGRTAPVRDFADAILAAGALSHNEAERVGDLMVVVGDKAQARTLYEGIYVHSQHNERLGKKIAALEADDDVALRGLAGPYQVRSARQGAALALYDMAYILFQERSDSSVKLFVHMALALDPEMADAHMLLADTLSRNGRLAAAITQLGNIPADYPSYLPVRRHAAELLAEVGRIDEALALLESLFTDHDDIESLIRIGDLHRRAENYSYALTAYNRAAQQIGGKIPEDYWYLLYARGMAYEREGNWPKAESDLKAALVYRPDHPYLLNYLGYGWVDQGLNLEQSLELIKRAVSLRPEDGYIIDSLGWAKYRMGDYEQALTHLERAVELLPYDPTINDHLGDAYWKNGRRTEARFQWERALNFSDDAALNDTINRKLRYGLEAIENARHAGTETPTE